MSKISEALERAVRERLKAKNAKQFPAVPEKDYLKTRSEVVEEQMIGLYRSL